MSENVTRKFRQINRVKHHEYLAKEIHFTEVSPGKIRTIMVLDDDSRVDGITVDEKIHRMNLIGFDIVSSGKDGIEVVTAHHVGMLENKAWEEIFDALPPTQEAAQVEEPKAA